MTLSTQIHAQREAKRMRQAKPPKPQRSINGSDVYRKMQLVLMRSNRTLCEQTDVDQLLESPLAQLERLRTGKLDGHGFVEISEACACAAELANEIWLVGTDDTKAQMEALKPELLATADVLEAIAMRSNELGRYGQKAGELQVLQRAMTYYGELIAISYRGAVCRALMIAADNVKRALRGSK